jgi:hypothetical protein
MCDHESSKSQPPYGDSSLWFIRIVVNVNARSIGVGLLLLVMDKSVVVVVGARREWCQLIVKVVFK